MNRRSILRACLLGSLASFALGCGRAPGVPRMGAEVARPEEVLDFPTLYRKNCSACHGAEGRQGAAISLANPVYLAVAGIGTLRSVTANGVAGTSMPPFARSAGGMLTGEQIEALVQGMVHAWGRPVGTAHLPPHASRAVGDAARGARAFGTFCARCHGADGTGLAAGARRERTGSLVDPSYLALVSDQALRSAIVAGRPDDGMPDWRSDVAGAGARAMTDEEIADTVAWLVGHRVQPAGPGVRRH